MESWPGLQLGELSSSSLDQQKEEAVLARPMHFNTLSGWGWGMLSCTYRIFKSQLWGGMQIYFNLYISMNS